MWCPVQVGDVEGLDFSEVGIVSGMSDALAEARISVFYFSTFMTDFTLVQQDKVASASAALTKRRFRVDAPRVVPVLALVEPPRCYSPRGLSPLRGPRHVAGSPLRLVASAFDGSGDDSAGGRHAGLRSDTKVEEDGGGATQPRGSPLSPAAAARLSFAGDGDGGEGAAGVKVVPATELPRRGRADESLR